MIKKITGKSIFKSWPLVAALILNNGIAHSAEEVDDMVIKLAHSSSSSEKDPLHRFALKFAERVEENSKGKIIVKVFPSGQLGIEERTFQDVQAGIIETTILTSTNITPFSPSVGIFDFPFIFPTRDDAQKALPLVMPKLNEFMVKESGTRSLGWLEQGYRVMTNSVRPIKNLNDIQGLKIRAPNNRYVIKTFESWDISPSIITWAETYNAVQQHVVDGVDDNYSGLLYHKFNEIQDYATEVNYKMWLGSLIVNERWMKKQPVIVQEWLTEAGNYAMQDSFEYIIGYEQKAKKELSENGLDIYGEPDDIGEWIKRAESTWPEFYSRIPDIALLDSLLEILNKERP